MHTCRHTGAKTKQAKKKGINTEWVREGVTIQIYSRAHVFTHKHTRIVAVGAVCRLHQGLGAWQLESRVSVEGGQMRWAWPTRLWVRVRPRVCGGGLSSWNTQGLTALTSFNLICIRPSLGANIVFHCGGKYTGSQKTATDGRSLPGSKGREKKSPPLTLFLSL